MLTDLECRNALCPPGRKRERLSDAGGLYLEIGPNGSKRWFWKFRLVGVEKRMALGGYPAVSLTQARKARNAARQQKESGADPVQSRKSERLVAINPAGDTFKAVALEWHEMKSPGWSPGRPSKATSRIPQNCIPARLRRGAIGRNTV